MSLNPTAILVWGIAASIGYLINDVNGAVIGFLIAGSINLFADLFL